MRKKLYIKYAAVFLTIALIITLMPSNIRFASAQTGKTIVVIDPGHDNVHGGGGRGSGILEEVLTLKIAQYCQAELERYANIEVYMTRSTANCPGPKGCTNSECLQARVDYAKSVGADIFISIHLDDSASSTPSGAMVIVPAKGVYRDDISNISHEAGTIVLRELVNLGLKNRGLFTKLCTDGNNDDGTPNPEYIYPNGAFTDWYGIIRKNTRAGIPSMIVEHCFMSNPNEAAKYLKDENMLKALGVADATAIAEFFSERANPSMTAAADSSAAYHPEGSAVITAKLSGCSNYNNAGKQINFYVNGNPAGTAVTNSNGEASFTPVNLNAGSYVFNAVFDGDERNASAGSSGSFTVEKALAEVSDGGTLTIPYAYAGENIGGLINLTVSGIGGETLTGIWSCTAPEIPGVTEAFFIIMGGTGSPLNYLPVMAQITVASIISEEEENLEEEENRSRVIEAADAEITLTDRSWDLNLNEAFISSVPNGNIIGTIVSVETEASGLTGFNIKIQSMPEESVSRTGVFKYNETTGKFGFVPHTTGFAGGDLYISVKSAPDGVYAVSENYAAFDDVADDGWYKEYVSIAAAKGIVNGTGNGRYEPERDVTRAEFVQMIVNAAHLPQAGSDTPEYNDVSEDKWHYPAIMRAKSAGLLDSFANSDFQPDKPVTREEMACILAAAVKRGESAPAYDADDPDLLNIFTDYPEFDEAYIKDIALIYNLSIMVGVGDGKFDSKGVTTRAQAAAVQIRMLAILGMI